MANETQGSETAQFVVKTKGYQETFASKSDAEKQYDILRKRSIKKDENIRVELAELDSSGKKKTLKSLNLTENFNS
ncbi:hypothetical protein ACFOW1_03610 [Parasediminibacterium paludis]|uniref:Uncharacterized protein n=1 Tax=Parasediminibacterium paludis TaxID=908966 RepID=A0ABV8PVM5_9BACT